MESILLGKRVRMVSHLPPGLDGNIVYQNLIHARQNQEATIVGLNVIQGMSTYLLLFSDGYLFTLVTSDLFRVQFDNFLPMISRETIRKS